MVEEINRLRKANESLGGTFEVRAFGLVPGLGSHISWEDRLDGRLAGAVASIQSVKGVSIGEAWDVAGRPGSEAHDEIFWSEERGYFRETNHAGGLEGGMTNGQPLSVRAAIKPISTLTKPLRSVDTETKEPAQALRERTDSTVVPAAAVVAEAMVCLTLARCYREKFGGDHIDDVLAARRRLQGAHRLPAGEPVSRPAIVFIGFMGAGKCDRARRRARRRPGDDRDRRADGSASSASRSPRPSSATARRAFRAREAEVVGELLESADGGAIALGGGSVLSRAGPRGARPPHRRLAAGRRRRGLARGSPDTRPAAGDQRRGRRRACSPSALPLYEELADAVVPTGDARPVARALPAIRGAARTARRDEAALGRERLRRVPGVRRAAGLLDAGLGGRWRAARFCVTDTAVAGALRERARRRWPAGSRSSRARSSKTMAEAEQVLRELAGRGDDAARTTWSRSAAASSATSPGSAPTSTSAACRSSRCRPRWSPRSTPPTAARPASTCPRARTTPAPTTCRPR